MGFRVQGFRGLGFRVQESGLILSGCEDHDLVRDIALNILYRVNFEMCAWYLCGGSVCLQVLALLALNPKP